MLGQGTPLHVVPEILEHARVTISKDVYGHLVEGAASRRHVHALDQSTAPSLRKEGVAEMPGNLTGYLAAQA